MPRFGRLYLCLSEVQTKLWVINSKRCRFYLILQRDKELAFGLPLFHLISMRFNHVTSPTNCIMNNTVKQSLSPGGDTSLLVIMCMTACDESPLTSGTSKLLKCVFI